MPPSFTLSALLCSICHWISAIRSIEVGVSRHLAEGTFPKVPVLVHGGSRIRMSACSVSGTEMRASAMIDSAISTPMCLTWLFQTVVLRFE